jgi:uncharacterized membrane protein/predicted DsbA family dithiol-disulfide isomerase
MEIAHRLHLTRLFALVALTVSAALLVENVRHNPRLCGFDSACEQVLHSPFGRVLGIPLPVFGVAVFGSLFVLSLFPSARTGWLLQSLALAGGLGGLGLILLQVFVLRRLCPYCLAVDVSAVLLAAFEIAGRWGRPLPEIGRRARSLWLGVAAVVLVSAVTLAAAGSRASGPAPGPVPPEVTALWIPGKVNVVEIADFACPHCRKMHAVLELFLDEERDRVHFARITAPLPGHPQARAASRAFLCAERQGRGDAMAAALYAAREPTPEWCEQLAAVLGLSLPEYRACLADPATDQRLDANVAWAQAASPRGLPVLWIQDQMFFGEQPINALREALRRADSAGR